MATAKKTAGKSIAAPSTKRAPAAKPSNNVVAAKKAASPAKPAAAKKGNGAKPVATKRRKDIPLEQKQHYIEVAAYFMAERRGFNGGSELEDWIAAEAEIDRLLAEGLLNP